MGLRAESRGGHRHCNVLTFRKEGFAMLSGEDNELLTRTGPGTAMGDLIRRYWIPVVE